MKRLFIILAAVIMAVSVMGQETANTHSAKPQEKIVAVPPTKADVNFKLYPTQNQNIFLLLDTRNGRIWIEQWGLKSKDRVEATLSAQQQVFGEDAIPGRFELYPTTNIFNFIMVDQVSGNTWQVQWNFEPENRMVVRIN